MGVWSEPEADLLRPEPLSSVFLCRAGMLQRRPTIEDLVDALVSELQPNFETFVMDSES